MATINGMVARRAGETKVALSGVPVAIEASTESHPDIAALTDARGCYSLGGLGPGSYVLGAEGGRAEAVIETGSDEVRCDILLDPGGACGGPANGLARASSVTRSGPAGPVPTSEQGAASHALASGPGPDETEIAEGHGADPYAREDRQDPIEEIGLIASGLIHATLVLHLAAGNRDRNALTDIAYGVLHPEEPLPFSTDDPDFTQKSAEWRDLRRDVVDPLLAEDVPATPDATSVTPFGLSLQRMPDGPDYKVRRNGVNWALPQVVKAMQAVAAKFSARHPGVTLYMLDFSAREGGRLYPPHQSHACGLDIDCQLRIGGRKLCMTDARYAEFRPLWQELVNLLHGNGVLPVKVIGFSDAEVSGVSHWSGHGCHVHCRFCAPPDLAGKVEEAVDAIYADRPRGKRPSYRCRDRAFETVPEPQEETHYVLVPSDYLDAEGGFEMGSLSLGLVQRGLVYAAIGLAFARGLRGEDRLTDEGWKTVFPGAEFPLHPAHEDYPRKRHVWLEIRDMVRGFLSAAEPTRPAPPPVAQTCRNLGRPALRRLAVAAEAATGLEGFADFAQGAAWTESRWNNCAINDSASEARAARQLFLGARRRGWFPDTPFGAESFAFSGGPFGLMPATGLIAGGNSGPFINADPHLVTDPAAAMVMIADFAVRILKKYDAGDWGAIRRAMAGLFLVHQPDHPRALANRARFVTGLEQAGADDPEALIALRPETTQYPGAHVLWSHLAAVALP